MSTLWGVPYYELTDWYPKLEVAFQMMAAGSNGRWELSDIVNQILAREQQVWVSLNDGVIEAVLLTEIVTYPRRKALRFSSCVGKNWRNWAHFHAQIEEWGKAQGCNLFEVYAPRKWRHCFPDYREFHILMEKNA